MPLKASATLAIIVSLATLLAFVGLIPLGRWHDEYLTLHDYHQGGIGFLWARLLHWSPRPLSELLIYFYGLTVYRVGLPLIGAFIAPFWILLIAAILWPVLRGRQGLLPACVLLAMLLLGHPVAEVFYWPFGVVAYLPTLTAAAMLLAIGPAARPTSIIRTLSHRSLASEWMTCHSPPPKSRKRRFRRL